MELFYRILRWIINVGYAYYLAVASFAIAAYGVFGVIRYLIKWLVGNEEFDPLYVLLGLAITLTTGGFGWILWKIARDRDDS